MSGNDPDIIRIAVASDLHAHAIDGESPSHLDIRIADTLPNQHPISGLYKLIEEKSLTADLLLCPGDLGHQSSPEAIKYAWERLQQLGIKLGVKLVTGTAGNHDIDSRYKGDDHCPEHILKGLLPRFPLEDEALWDRYWARAYAIVDLEECRLLLLNSSAYHGRTAVEKNHGRIDKQTLVDIEQELKKRGKREINVLLCHHHPQMHSELGLGESDVMKQGQLLLDLLGNSQYGSWLVLHGHKHHPKITYAAGGSSSPIIFAAGSLSSKLFLPLQTVGRNQFYLIEIRRSEVEAYGLVGRAHCWDWAFGTGWIPASDSSGLPATFGFGWRQNAVSSAREIAEIVGTHDTLDWKNLVKSIPTLSFLTPQDLSNLEKELTAVHQLRLQRDGPNILQIGKVL
jgi:3',5'-cyclic AMP phosphodiesterase CpdA